MSLTVTANLGDPTGTANLGSAVFTLDGYGNQLPHVQGALLSTLSVTAKAGSGVQLPNFFGLDITMFHPAAPINVPFQSFRFWDNNCRWNALNTSAGVFDFTEVDFWLNKIRAVGVTDCLMELGGTPPWASSVPGQTGCDLYNGNLGYCQPPSDLNSNGTGTNQNWRLWCKAIAQHFSANTDILVSGWCPWNEFTRQADDTGTKSWLGTDAQMVRLAQDARAIILGRGSITATGETAAQAQATVSLSGPAYIYASRSAMLSPSTGLANNHNSHAHWTSYQGTAGADDAAEVIATHSENSTTATGALVDWNGFETVLDATNLLKPMWITEISWLGNSPSPDAPTVLTGWYNSLYGKVQRMYWYAYNGSAPLADTAGVLTAAGTAFAAVFNAQPTAGAISQTLLGNDVITPAGTTYTVTVYSNTGALISSNRYSLTGSGTVDLSTLTPLL